MKFLMNKKDNTLNKFVDETIDLMFRYISTTESAMKKILKYVRELKGDIQGNLQI